jgi:7-carboxy-7-deazaguanine synthase
MNKLMVNEVFYSLQGEGYRAGQASVFVRFTGCNLRCSMHAGPKSPGGFDCDTEFTSGVPLDLSELIARVHEVIEPNAPASLPWVVFTGGEPGLQLTKEVITEFRKEGFRSAVETNGTIDVSQFEPDWITLSPKVAEHAVKLSNADELKYVRGHGQGIPNPSCKAPHKYISPAFAGLDVDPQALAWCIQLVKAHPDWTLSVQQHKLWGIR